MRTRTLFAVSLLLAGAGLSAQTMAPSTIGLFNTGMGTSSTYRLIGAPVIPGISYSLYEPSSTVWPIDGPWIENVTTGTNDVQWLAVYSGSQIPSNNAGVPTVAAGDYTIRLDFTLGNYNPSTVGFAIHASADNRLAVSLNGLVLPNYGTASGDENYTSLASYLYTVNGAAPGSGLVAGANWIDFVVTNAAGDTGNPAGLYVTFSDFTVVPEPSTYALWLGCATGAMVLWRRRRAGVAGRCRASAPQAQKRFGGR